MFSFIGFFPTIFVPIVLTRFKKPWACCPILFAMHYHRKSRFFVSPSVCGYLDRRSGHWSDFYLRGIDFDQPSQPNEIWFCFALRVCAGWGLLA